MPRTRDAAESLTVIVGLVAHAKAVSDAWAALVEWYDDKAAAVLHRELAMLSNEARSLELDHLLSLTSGLEKAAAVARARAYAMPDEFVLTVTMGIEFLTFLASAPNAPDLNVEGFLAQLTDICSDAAPVADTTIRDFEGDHTKDTSAPSGASPDEFVHGARLRIASAATSVYLESLSTPGAASLRLREAWTILRNELASANHVAIRPRLERHIDEVRAFADHQRLAVRIALTVEDVFVVPEICQVLDVAAIQLLTNAVGNIEPPEQRESAGKPVEGQVRLGVMTMDGGLVVTVDDDGPGMDTASDLTQAGAREREFPDLRALLMQQKGSIRIRNPRGNGTSVEVTIANAVDRRNVYSFRLFGSDLLFAIDATWSIAAEDGTPTVDALRALSLPVTSQTDARGRRVVFRHNDRRIAFTVRSTPTLGLASTLCPTPLTDPVEVIRVGATEALLLRPEWLFDRDEEQGSPVSTSTIKPSGF